MDNSQENTKNNQNETTEKPKSKGMELIENLYEKIEIEMKLLKENSFRINESNNIMNILFQSIESFNKKENKILSDLNSLKKTFEEEAENRNQFLNNFPKNIDVNLSENNLKLIEKINKQAYFIKTFVYLGIGFLIFGLADFFFVTKIAVEWYGESIKSHQEMLSDYKKQGRTVVSAKYLEALENNNEMIKQFINQNPKDAETLMNFKNGYDAKK